jgi:hypothetical protein
VFYNAAVEFLPRRKYDSHGDRGREFSLVNCGDLLKMRLRFWHAV